MLTESALTHLLTDLMALRQTAGFGTDFTVALSEPDVYHDLALTFADGRKYRAQYSDYPSKPAVSPTPEWTAAALAEAETISQLVAVLGRPPLTPFLSQSIERIEMKPRMLTMILDDFSRHAPNEYAFLLSGKLENEIATITAYFPGEMAISTPFYCELTPEFIERTVYDELPKHHDILVWGHVHPIEGPSGTDSESFDDLADWDRQIAQLNTIKVRSLALLVSSFTKTPSFYDVHSGEQVPLGADNI